MSLSAHAAAHSGRHICLPFESDDERSTAVLAFFREGLSHRNRCLFVGTPAEYDELVHGLETSGVSAKRAQAEGALRYLTQADAYLDGSGGFDPELVLARVAGWIDRALAEGFTGLRGTGELMNVPSDAEWQKIVWYEAQINEHFSRAPLVGLCRYRRAVVPPERVRDVLRTHPVALVRGEPCDNPFYERPALALSGDDGARLDWQLRQLRVQNRTQRLLEGQAVSAVTAAVELATELEQLRDAIRKTEV